MDEISALKIGSCNIDVHITAKLDRHFAAKMKLHTCYLHTASINIDFYQDGSIKKVFFLECLAVIQTRNFYDYQNTNPRKYLLHTSYV